MGTRSTTRVIANIEEVLCLYRQFDGYPECHGQELKDFLMKIKLTRGIASGQEGNTANGMQCLAAQIVAHFKMEAGGFYLCPPGQTEEYDYLVFEESGEIHVEVRNMVRLIYKGPISEWKI